MRMSELKLNELGVIAQIEESPVRKKLMEMGCIPGTRVQLVLVAPFGDPKAYDIEGYRLSLRENEASTVILE